jgi:hypothetical protein
MLIMPECTADFKNFIAGGAVPEQPHGSRFPQCSNIRSSRGHETLTSRTCNDPLFASRPHLARSMTWERRRLAETGCGGYLLVTIPNIFVRFSPWAGLY